MIYKTSHRELKSEHQEPLKYRKIIWITVASLPNFDNKQLLWRNIMLFFMFQNIYKMLQK
jgi:hypothetical protein